MPKGGNRPTCSIVGCGAPNDALGLCASHYGRLRRHGDPLIRLRTRHAGSVAERFWAKVDKRGPVPPHRPELGSCWLWTAARDQHGYGRVGWGLMVSRAHRWSYASVHGPIPAGQPLDHLCVNPPCVRPSHLELVPQAENMRRATIWTRRAQRQRAQTHCRNGHELSASNTYVKPNGSRNCRACRAEAGRRYRSKP